MQTIIAVRNGGSGSSSKFRLISSVLASVFLYYSHMGKRMLLMKAALMVVVHVVVLEPLCGLLGFAHCTAAIVAAAAGLFLDLITCQTSCLLHATTLRLLSAIGLSSRGGVFTTTAPSEPAALSRANFSSKTEKIHSRVVVAAAAKGSVHSVGTVMDSS